FFALPNLLANQEIFIELIHPYITEDEVVLAIKKTLQNPKKGQLDLVLNQIRANFNEEEFVKKLIQNTPFEEQSIKRSL
ncbi:MAG: hypothetical protein KGQ54_04050, partial [Verrucomicrobia bacterium]|nr:hypothetical protein [Verrucomicrobiota bacterium]